MNKPILIYSLIFSLSSPFISLKMYDSVKTKSINFVTNGGSHINSVEYEIGETIFIPETTKIGHTFSTWYLDELFTQNFSLRLMPSRDLTLYAKWMINEYTFSFYTDGGSEIAPISGNYGDPITAPKNPTKQGHTFIGWFSDATLRIPKSIPILMSPLNMNFYAKWSVNQYTISFETNGGYSIQTQTANYNAPLNIPDPLKVGHSFVGWFTDVGLTQVFNMTIMPAENITIYAEWSINQYTITFDTNGGNTISNENNYFGDVLILPTPIKVGYTFAGWFGNLGLTQVSPSNMPAHDIILYAKWSINQYTISFESNDGNSISSATYYFGENLILPTPTKFSHTFYGWFTDLNLTQMAPSTMPAQNITLYAKWIVFYTISFITNSGHTISNETFYFGENLTLPTPTNIGYTFAGWFTDMNLTQAAPSTMPAQDFTLYAMWNVNQYTISFNTNGGTIIPPITGNFGDPVSIPNNPTKEGYTFQGWYSDAALTIPATISGHIPSSNMSYFANWVILKYTVTWTNYDGTILQRNFNVSYGTIPTYNGSTPSRPSTYHSIPWSYWRSYTFKGWSPSISPVHSNQTYVASFN